MSPLIAALPWRYILPAVGGAALIAGAFFWHSARVADAHDAGRAEQAALDAKAFANAYALAEKAQADAVAKTAATAAKITERTADALERKNDDLANRYDALRLRWAEGNSSRARDVAAASPAYPAASFDAAACTARGWVDFDTAATTAQAADVATARAEAWREWWLAQAEAWPE